jgi:DNA-binding CsgD family transcriptional regulator
VARASFAEAIGLARAVDDRWRLSQILARQAQGAHTAGDPLGVRAAGEEGRDLADAIGDRFNSRVCRFYLRSAQMMQGDLAGAAAQFGEVAAEAEAAHDEMVSVLSLAGQSIALAHQGEAAAARAAAEAALEGGAEPGGRFAAIGHVVLGIAALAAGEGAAAHEAREAARQDMNVVMGVVAPMQRAWNAEAALADEDLAAARRWADEAVSTTTGWWLMQALTARARVAIAQGEPEQAERDAHEALACAAGIKAYLFIPDILECLAALAGQDDSHREAARLFGAAEAIRHRMGAVRFKVWDAGYEASVAALRDALGEQDFDSAWVEGAALSVEEAIAYTQRGRGERKRPTSGWASLTPTERDVVRLVSEGLANNDIATRLFVSPRTVQTHLTHVYTKLGLTSRVQLVQEAARHT